MAYVIGSLPRVEKWAMEEQARINLTWERRKVKNDAIYARTYSDIPYPYSPKKPVIRFAIFVRASSPSKPPLRTDSDHYSTY